MANLKVSDFTATTSVSGSDIIPVVQSGANKKITYDNLVATLRPDVDYPEVTAYTDLPAAATVSGKIYVVLTSTSSWVILRKAAGLWYSDGASWTRLGDWHQMLNDGNAKIVNSSDTTKVVAFDASGITTGTTRTMTFPNKDGTLTTTKDVYPPQLGHSGM